MPESEKRESTNGWPRMLVGLIVGWLGAVFVWIVTPYNNAVILNSFISDDYMPAGAFFVIIVLVLIVNPLLRMIRPWLGLDFKQMAIVFGMVLVASVTPGQGLLRQLPHAVARNALFVNEDKRLSDAYEAANPRPSLFVDELGFGKPTTNSGPFVHELAPGDTVPWGAWVPPLFSWGGFFVPFWIMMVALVVIVYPQWRDNERLPFPLLRMQRMLIQSPEQGKLYPPLLRNSVFLTGAIAVFVIHFPTGVNAYFPDALPTIPLSWDMKRFFQEPPLSNLSDVVTTYRLSFIFIGMAFFMPNRVGFSIWFFQVAYAIYFMLGASYFPPFNGWQLALFHRGGAYFGVTLGILWLGRAHWRQVARAVIFGGPTAESRRDRFSGIAFIVGCAGMFLWFLWVGAGPGWALFMIWCAFMYALVLTRMVCETGLPLLAPSTAMTTTMLRLVPTTWHTAASSLMTGLIAFFLGQGNRVCAAVMAIHGLGMDDKASPRKQMRLAGLFVVVLIASLIICGAAHTYYAYHHSTTLSGQGSPISGWGSAVFSWTGNSQLLQWQDGVLQDTTFHPLPHMIFGATFAGILQWLCMYFPRWPFHPVALVFILGWDAHKVWFNVFLGWLAKILILRYGGSRLYHKMLPLFLGLIIGELIAVAFWVLVTVFCAMQGWEYKAVRILPF
ncbi:DUF6785 family protein [Candidatus Sumerlaeota bacterium]